MNKAIIAIAAVAAMAVAGFLFQLLQPQPLARTFEIPSGSSACSGGKITVYAYNNGFEPMNVTSIETAQITGPKGTYTPQLETTTIEPGHSEVIIAAYGCGDAATKCPSGTYTIRLGATENAATDRLTCS